MANERAVPAGNLELLILGLLDERDLYGYAMIEELGRRSQNLFSLKAGTLYPLLHTLERKGLVSSYEGCAEGARIRKYYGITKSGRRRLREKKKEWKAYAAAVDRVLGVESFATA